MVVYRKMSATPMGKGASPMSPPYCYDYPRPAVTVDLVVFALVDGELRVLLIRRKHDPFAGRWAIPGGFLEIDEPIEAAARRELREETGLDVDAPITPIGVFGARARPARPDDQPGPCDGGARAPGPGPREATTPRRPPGSRPPRRSGWPSTTTRSWRPPSTGSGAV